MIETELKILLDASGEARLARHPKLAELRLAPRRTERLRSVYYDTPGHDLAGKRLALRLRTAGRSWVQTVKRGDPGGRTDGGGGLFSHLEVERPAPGGRLALDGPDPDGVYAAIEAAADGAALSPVFETRVRRTVERLQAPGGGVVELAIDRGEIVAGDATAPIREAELELVAGGVDDVFALARLLFDAGPVRFGTENKAARGYRLLRREPEPPLRARKAGKLAYAAETPVEAVARDVLRDCQAQIAANIPVVLETDDPEGPHQLRVGLRRLRTVFSVFGPSLGAAAFAALGATARDLGRTVGGLRDLDVLTVEVVPPAAEGLDAAALAALAAGLAARHEAVRDRVRRTLAGPETTGFLLDLAALVEARGWLVPADYSQTARLAAPIGEVAPGILDRRLKKVRKRGRAIRKLDAPALHELRKELKKLRYAADTLAPIYPEGRVGDYLAALRELQDAFGSLNDGAMASELLAGSEVGGLAAPAAQRAVGWVLGSLAHGSRSGRPALYARWDDFREAEPFWR